MILPMLFLAWLWGRVHPSLKVGPKSGHRATAVVNIAVCVAYLALVYTAATTLVVALPTVCSLRLSGFP